MADPHFLAESTHAGSGRTAVIDAEVDSVWLYLLDEHGQGIETTAWLFNRIESPQRVDSSYRERAAPPPVTAALAAPGAHCRDLASIDWSFAWSRDGNAVAAYADGVCVGFTAVGTRGFSRYLLEESSWGSPWSASLYDELF